MEASTKNTVQKIPLLTVKAGPRDGEKWVERLKEEYTALIKVNFLSSPICTTYRISGTNLSMVTVCGTKQAVG